MRSRTVFTLNIAVHDFHGGMVMRTAILTVCLISLCLGSPALAQDHEALPEHLFSKLIKISQKESIDRLDLRLAYGITKYLYIFLPDADYGLVLDSFGAICIRCNCEEGAELYIKHVIATVNCADERISYTFGDLFLARPQITLSEVSKLRSDKRSWEIVIYSLLWGVSNNKDVALTKEGLLELFDNPKEIYQKYQPEIDYLVETEL
jgi:hypothetical protein